MTRRKPNKAKTPQGTPRTPPVESEAQLDELFLKLRDAAYEEGNPVNAALFELAHSRNVNCGDDHRTARAATLRALEQAGLR